MKSAIEWFKEKGFTFDGKITVKDVIDRDSESFREGIIHAETLLQNLFNPYSGKSNEAFQKCRHLASEKMLMAAEEKRNEKMR